MVKDLEIFVALLIALFCIILIYNARLIAKKRFSKKDENKYTNIIKIIGFVIFAGAFITIYYIR
ncbi:MAG: hypothetical protein RSA08_00790 [Clostridia bacterium]